MTSHYGVGNVAADGADAIKGFIISNTYQALMYLKYSDALCYAVHTLNYGEETQAIVDLTQTLFDGSFTTNLTSTCDAADVYTINGYLNGQLDVNGTHIINSTTNDIINLPGPEADCIVYLHQ